MYDLPLFPLNTVLFPGMSLPLHIFEERYKLMVNHCVQTNRPFGVVLIKSGDEVGTSAETHGIGTTAHITNVERLSDGRMNVATVGTQRFRIAEYRHDLAYLHGIVEDFPLEGVGDTTLSAEISKLTRRLREYLDIFAKLGNVEIDQREFPTDPMTLAFLVAIIVRMPMEDKQNLLRIPTLAELVKTENHILWRESELLNVLIEQGQHWRNDDSPFSLN